jgi:Taurine catabolism dioxygenase TauD, TfdA family
MHDEQRPPIPVGTTFQTPSAWRGADVQASREWVYQLDAAGRDELRRACDAVRSHSGDLGSLRRDVFRFQVLAPALRHWRGELQAGRGFVLVRGVPIESATATEAGRLYWLLGRELGDPVPQNGTGELLCDVRDTGASPADPNTRLYTTRAEQDFHTDGADIIGLLAIRGAKSGGTSRIASSVTVFNELQQRRPDLVPCLFEPWPFRITEKLPPGMPAWFAIPLCRYEHGALATFFIPWYIRAAQALPDVPRLTSQQEQALAAIESIANEPGLYVDMHFQPGDIQWLKNSVILHKRTAYEDHPEPERKRHLLRLWLTARDFEDGHELLRRGIDPSAAT